MHSAHEFLSTVAMVLCVAAVATIVFQRLRQPVVFGYLLAGLIVGPHVPIPLVANEEIVRTLAELGVILLLFSLGLEFSLRKLFAIGTTAAFVAVAQSSAMMWLGYEVAQGLGWTTVESAFAGAVIAISSTTIIVKAFAEQGVRGRVSEVVFGVLIIEDLIAIFLLVVLTAVSSPGGLTPSTVGITAIRLTVFLVVLTGVGLLTVPRLIRFVVRLERPETTLVASVGIAFAFALIAVSFEYSVALGAFLAGALIGESGVEKTVEHLVAPVRDVFAAVFFVSVGMLIVPSQVAEHWLAIVLLTVVVIVGKGIAVTVSAFLTGIDLRTSIQAGLSLGQIGEFSFIIAGLGLAAGTTGGFLYPVAVAVSAATTLTTPWLIRAAGPTAAFVDRRLPRALQTFTALYGSWIERLRETPRNASDRSAMGRLVWLALIDVIAIVVLIIGTAVELPRLAAYVSRFAMIDAETARIAVAALAFAAATPLVFGLVATARRIATRVGERALPLPLRPGLDTGLAPRRALVTAVQFGIVMAAGVPVVALTQPFLPPFGGAAILAVVLSTLAIAFWVSAANLQGHARAGAEVIASAIGSQSSVPDGTAESARQATTIDEMLPGLGHPVAVILAPASVCVGRSLRQINLRSATGATVLAITRGKRQILVPSGHELLEAGDVLALAGTHEAIAEATALLNSEISLSGPLS